MWIIVLESEIPFQKRQSIGKDKNYYWLIFKRIKEEPSNNIISESSQGRNIIQIHHGDLVIVENGNLLYKERKWKPPLFYSSNIKCKRFCKGIQIWYDVWLS